MSSCHSKESLVCWKIISETFNRLGRFSKEKLENSISAICSDGIDVETLAVFIAICHPEMSTGRYAALFRMKVTKAISMLDSEKLKYYYREGLSNLDEVYRNPFLSSNDKKIITDHTLVDVQTIMSMIHNYKDHKSQGKDMVSCDNSYYGKCKHTVCLSEGLFPISTDVPTNVYFYDKSLHCYNILDLIEFLASNTGSSVINPQSGKPFLDETLRVLRSKYYKEIAIFRYIIEMTK